MTENIDASQHLKRNESVVNSFRAAKGDLLGRVEGEGATRRITYAEVRDVSIARGLIERGFLEDYHRMYAITLAELRDAYYGRPLGAAFTSCLEMFLPRTISRPEAKEFYAIVSRKLSPKRIHIILHAINEPYESDSAAKIIPGINAYRDCFEMMVQVMDDAKSEVEKDVA